VDAQSLDRLEFPRVTADVANHAESSTASARLRSWTPIAVRESRAQETTLLHEAIGETREPGSWLAVGTAPIEDLLDKDRR
jgi:hypothetical protein